MANPKSLSRLRAEARNCRACPLWKNATERPEGERIRAEFVADLRLAGDSYMQDKSDT